MSHALKIECQRNNGVRGNKNLPSATVSISGEISNWPVRVIDIGYGGMAIETDLVLLRGDSVSLILEKGEKRSVMLGLIVSAGETNSSHRYGIKFNTCDSTRSASHFKEFAHASGAIR